MGFFDKLKAAATDQAVKAKDAYKGSADKMAAKITEASDSLVNKNDELAKRATDYAAKQQAEAEALKARTQQAKAEKQEAQAVAQANQAARPDVDSSRVVRKLMVRLYKESHQLVDAASIRPHIYQLDDSTVTFNLTHAQLYQLAAISFDGAAYHQESSTFQVGSAGKDTIKKHRHGVGGAVLGTIAAPGLGTAVGAVIGSHSGKDTVKHGKEATTMTVESQVEDWSTIRLTLKRLEDDKIIEVPYAGKAKDWKKIQEFDVTPLPEEPVQESTSVISDDVVEQLTKLKSLLDAGVITQDDFDAKKQELLGI